MQSATICSKCGAPSEGFKCQFCGSQIRLDTHEKLSLESDNKKIIAEREYSIGNYSSALSIYEDFYKINPNDPYVLVRRGYCLYELEKIDLTQFVFYLEESIDLAQTTDFQIYIIEFFIDYVSFKIKEQNIDSIGLFTRLDNLCSSDIKILDIAINKLIKSMSDPGYVDNYETFTLILLYDSINTLSRPITLGDSGKNGFEGTNEYYFIQKTAKSISGLKKDKWKRVWDFEDYMIPCPEYGDLDIAPLYIIDGIETPFVEKLAYKYIDSYFEKLRLWTDEQWEEKLSNIPKDIKNVGIISVLNKRVNEILAEREKPFKYLFPVGVQKSGLGIGGKSACFVATATMGSNDHPVVIDLRLFRDSWLLSRHWGVKFVNWYYRHAPKAADIISDSFLLKKISFIIIVKPLHFFTKIILGSKRLF